MQDSPQTLTQIVQTIRKPLEFAAKNNFALLKTVKGLDSLLLSMTQQTNVLNCTELNKKTLREISEQFMGFYGKPLEEQQKIITDAIEKLNQAYSLLDKFVKKNIIHKNTAANKKARLASYVNSL